MGSMLQSKFRFPQCLPWLWAVITWLWLLSGLAGCVSPSVSGTPDTGPATATPAGAGTEPQPAPSSLSGTFLIWHSWIDEDYEALVAILDRIQAEHPQLVLATRFMEAHQIPTQLLNAILRGEGPQLLLAPASRYPELQADELITSFNDVVQVEDLDPFLSPAIYGLIHDARLMGLPLWTEAVMLYVNTDMMSWSQIPDSTAQWLALAEQADRPWLGLYQNLFYLSWGFPAYGSVLFDADFRVVLDQSAGAAAFLTWLAAASAAPGIEVSDDYDALKQAFLNQELAMLVDGPWNLTEYSLVLGDALRVRELPDGPAGAARPWLTSEAIYLVAGQSPSQRLASARIALRMTDSEQILIETAHRLPAVQNRMNIGPEPVQTFRALLADTQHMAHRPEMASVWRQGQDMLDRAVAGEPDTEALTAQFTLLVNEENRK